jgi:predicted nucleic acid-binding Zn ribbon protein
MIERACPICDTSFITYPREDKQTCSKSCSRKLYIIDHKIITKTERICPICGAPFITWPSVDQQTCSAGCGMKLRIKKYGHPKGMLGKKGHWTGKKRPIETKEKVSKTKKEYYRNHNIWNKAIHRKYNNALEEYYKNNPDKKLKMAYKGAQWNKERPGSLSPHWKGGCFPCYGENWIKNKNKIKKRANFISEISDNNGGAMAVHHIIPQRVFVQKYIDLCLSDIPSIKSSSFKVLPYDLIPSLLFDEANSEDNLIYLTKQEHGEFEGMPPTFFEAIFRLNDEKTTNGNQFPTTQKMGL